MVAFTWHLKVSANIMIATIRVLLYQNVSDFVSSSRSVRNILHVCTELCSLYVSILLFYVDLNNTSLWNREVGGKQQPFFNRLSFIIRSLEGKYILHTGRERKLLLVLQPWYPSVQHTSVCLSSLLLLYKFSPHLPVCTSSVFLTFFLHLSVCPFLVLVATF